MRSEEEMFDLILNCARKDARVRAVILNGSRANRNGSRDIFQDYDVVFVVTAVSPIKNDPDWIAQFGELMIIQTPDAMEEPPAGDEDRFAYLMQFVDGNRIDLTLYPLAKLDQLGRDSLSLLLLDKDGIIAPFGSPSERDYLPKPPTQKAYGNCCNEFWWVCTYVAKGLWREEITVAKAFEEIIRAELMKMLTWQIGVETEFLVNPGKMGKYFKRYLAPERWEMLQGVYSDASYENSWAALDVMCGLFRETAVSVAAHFGFDYPHGDDARVSAHLKHVQFLPRNAREMY